MNNAVSKRTRIQGGDPVILVLHSPREKCWGILDEVNAAGVFLRGLDLNAFDDWVRAVAHDEPFIGLSDLFFPMWRIERCRRNPFPLRTSRATYGSLSSRVNRQQPGPLELIRYLEIACRLTDRLAQRGLP